MVSVPGHSRDRGGRGVGRGQAGSGMTESALLHSYQAIIIIQLRGNEARRFAFQRDSFAIGTRGLEYGRDEAGQSLASWQISLKSGGDLEQCESGSLRVMFADRVEESSMLRRLDGKVRSVV